jgi:hypothetical protein
MSPYKINVLPQRERERDEENGEWIDHTLLASASCCPGKLAAAISILGHYRLGVIRVIKSNASGSGLTPQHPLPSFAAVAAAICIIGNLPYHDKVDSDNPCILKNDNAATRLRSDILGEISRWGQIHFRISDSSGSSWLRQVFVMGEGGLQINWFN